MKVADIAAKVAMAMGPPTEIRVHDDGRITHFWRSDSAGYTFIEYVTGYDDGNVQHEWFTIVNESTVDRLAVMLADFAKKIQQIYDMCDSVERALNRPQPQQRAPRSIGTQCTQPWWTHGRKRGSHRKKFRR